MTDTATAPTAALEHVERPPAVERMLLTDDEMRRMYRVAESLALSGIWKDIKKAEAAFAKMVVGRDLGMTPAQAMQGIHFVEGNIQLHYSMIGNFIRAREGYDYRAGWLKTEPVVIDLEGREPTPEEAAAVVEGQQRLVTVWFNEEQPEDTRPVVGAVVEVTVNGERAGLSRFTMDDAHQAKLVKDNDKAAWRTVPRNMLLARAMSNAAKWFVPEVLGGLPVYTDGEIPERKSLTAPAGDDTDAGSGVDLGPRVEKVIERATALGHRGLSNRAAIELSVGNRAPGLVNDWCVRANEELDRFAAEKAAAQPDAATGEVQGDTPAPAEVEVDAPPEEVTAEPVPEEPTPEVASPPDADEVPAGEATATTPDPDKVVEPENEAAVTLLRNRLERLNGIDADTLSEGDRDQLFAEIDHVEGQLRGLGVEVDR
jgi:hypothetical protein